MIGMFQCEACGIDALLVGLCDFTRSRAKPCTTAVVGKGENDLLAVNRAERSKVILAELVALLVGAAARARHRLGRDSVALCLIAGWRGHDRARSAATRGGNTGRDAGHAEAIGARESGWETVAIAVFGRRGWLAVFAVLNI
jgi:hypothetical protein